MADFDFLDGFDGGGDWGFTSVSEKPTKTQSKETETVVIPDTADHDTVHFQFNNDKHFDSAELFVVSIQSDTDITGTNERFWVTAVVEWDWSTYLGTKGTSTIYSSTP